MIYHNRNPILSFTIGFYVLSHTNSFPISIQTKTSLSKVNTPLTFIHQPISNLFMSNINNDNDNDNVQKGMEKAFEELNSLDQLDFDVTPLEKALEQRMEQQTKITKTTTAATTTSESTQAPEDELKMYTEMYTELETKGEDEMYGDVFDELTQDSISSIDVTQKNQIPEPNTEIDTLYTEESQEAFMNRAIEEAMEEAKNTAPKGQLSDSILDDEEMMKEISKVFDDANEKLLASIEDMRKEQKQMTKINAEQRTESMKQDEIRLAEAEGSISRLVDQVSKETKAVESAIRDLEQAKIEMNNDPLVKIANLRSAGIIKQGSFVLSLLFTIRSFTDFVLILGPNSESHATAAAVQAAIAVVCALVFFL